MQTEVIESGVDWVSVTAPTLGLDSALSKIAAPLAVEEHRRGQKDREFHAFGYTGWKVGDVTWGESPQGQIVQLRGVVADQNWHDLLPHAANVTRVDIQATVRYDPYDPNLEVRKWLRARKWVNPKGYTRTVGIYAESSGGQTLYVGTRKSNLYARVYDKAQQSDDEKYLNCHRWEVECKHDAAPAMLMRLAASRNTHAEAAALTYAHFLSRHVEPDWTPPLDRNPCPTDRPRPDMDKRIDWLRFGVAPAALEAVRRGRAQDVIDALQDVIDAARDVRGA